MAVRSHEVENKPAPRDAAEHGRDLSANQHNFSDKQNMTALLDHARSQFTRGSLGDSLDLGGHDKLFGSKMNNPEVAAARAPEAPTSPEGGSREQSGGATSREAHHVSHEHHRHHKHHRHGHHHHGHHEHSEHSDKSQKKPDTHTEADPKTVTAKQGDSLWKISREHLGPNASEHEVMNHVRDIAKENGMPDPFSPENRNNPKDAIHPGQQLKLPGQDKEGKPYEGPKPQEAPTVKPPDVASPKPTDVQRPQTDKPAEVPVDAAKAKAELDAEKQRLDQNMEKNHVSPEDQQRIHDNMKAFEDRAAKDKLPPDEVKKTYEAANKLYESTGDKPIPQADKAVLADQIIAHAANPTSIDQGQHNTCGPTSLESRLFATHPSEAAKLISDVGTTGSYTAKDGSKVNLDANDLKKDNEAGNNPPLDNERSYASKLFQETALDLHYQARGEHFKETPGSVPGDRSSYGLKDKEQIVDSRGRAKDFDGVTLNDLSDMETKITGRRDASHYLGNHEVYGNDRQQAGKITTFKNEEEFKQALTDAKKNGEMPLTVWVDSRQPPFGNGQQAGGGGGGHFVSITDYDDKTGKVSVDNQWGKAFDHLGDNGVPLHQMFEATHPPRPNQPINTRDIPRQRMNVTPNDSYFYDLTRDKQIGKDD